VRIFPGTGQRHHSGRDVHGDAADVAVALLDFAGVQPHPDLEADAAQLVSERGRTKERQRFGPAQTNTQHKKEHLRAVRR
jgi:hypothetical protein